eukprot:NODE_160_length_15021_cov_0.894786.p8 type:complete len:204 gc:universal NODE_160_length_15021_cov_0.894786:7554-8165(+)
MILRRSHIGRMTIHLDPKIKLDFAMPQEEPNSNPKKFFPDKRPNYAINIKGPLGEVKLDLFPFIRLKHNNNELQVSIENASNKIEKSMWGTTRSLINNAIIGCCQGHTSIVTLKGIGYRVSLKEENEKKFVGIKAGFSHVKYFEIPSDLKIEAFQTAIVISGVDKQRVKLFAHCLRSAHPPEPYKGKGIYVDDETVKLKERKK